MDEEPLNVTVVGDKRYTLGRRLGVLGVALIILMFVILGYKQSAKNGDKLDEPLDIPTPKIVVTLKPSPVPAPTGKPNVVYVPSPGISRNNENNQRPGTTNNYYYTTKPQPQSSSKPSPSPKPSPSRSPSVPVGPIVCDVTGICP